jgi:quinol monooxygenase YgiN
MIRINVQLIVDEVNRVKLLEYLAVLSVNSQLEKGCFAYDIYECASDDGKLLILETWESDAALKAHQQTSHYKNGSPKLRELAKDVKVERFVY